MSNYTSFFCENVTLHLVSGGYEIKSRIIKLIPSGDVKKVKELLSAYIPLLREHYNIMGLDFAFSSTAYILAQVGAASIISGIDDWIARDIKKPFYKAIDSATNTETLLNIIQGYIIEVTLSVYKLRREKNYSTLVQEICRYIYTYIDEKITIQKIAEHFHFSKSYISSKFKEETGFTLGEYILERRLNEAKSRLLQGIPASQISESLGFSSQSHFITVFKQKNDMTPKEWKSSVNTESNT